MNEQLKHLTAAVWVLVFVTLGSAIATCAIADDVESAVRSNAWAIDRVADHISVVSRVVRPQESIPVRIVSWPESTLRVYGR